MTFVLLVPVPVLAVFGLLSPPPVRALNILGWLTFVLLVPVPVLAVFVLLPPPVRALNILGCLTLVAVAALTELVVAVAVAALTELVVAVAVAVLTDFLPLPVIQLNIPGFLGVLLLPVPVLAVLGVVPLPFIQLNIPGFGGPPPPTEAFCVVSSFLFKNPGFFLKTPPRLVCCEVFKNPGFFLKTPPRLACCGGGPALVPVEVVAVKKAGFCLFLVGMMILLKLA